MKSASIFLFILSLIFASGCAYRMGYSDRKLPGGYKRVSIPIFTNRTDEVGAETYFTNALIRQFERSKVARVEDKSVAPAMLVGAIDSISYVETAKVTESSDKIKIPEGTVLTTEYRLLVSLSVRLIKTSDRKELWSGSFTDERVYSAPQIGLPVVNSANPLYNQSARHQNLELIAQDIMSEAHDRILENF